MGRTRRFRSVNRLLCLAAVAMTGACNVPMETQLPEASPSAATSGVADDGTYLSRIDPLGGQWRVEKIGDEDFTRFDGWISFSEGGFLNHGAGCRGGYPAVYRLDGDRISFVRREEIRTGKCAAASAGGQKAAADSELRLALFLDRAVGWSRPDDRTLILTGPDGVRALLTRPVEPHPELAGRWLIETIGGKPIVTEQRPATLSITRNSIGAFADCNSMGGTFSTPAPGRIAVSGPIISTAIGCAAEDAAEDALMTRAMTSVQAYRLEGDRLVFTGGPGMVVRRPPKPDRQLAGAYEHCGNTLLGAYHEGSVTLAIDASTMRDNAGCVASYQADGPRLTLRLEDGPACAAKAPPFVPGEPVGVGGAISTLAITRPDGFGFDEQGRLVLRTERGLLSMCRKGAPRPFGS